MPDVHAEVSRARNSTLLRVSTRIGFLGYALLHVLFAWVIIQIALERPSDEGDQSGALRTLAGQPFGRPLVAAVAAGIAVMAIWQGLEAAIGHRGERGTRRVLERLASAGRVLVYAYLAWAGVKVLRTAGSSSADKQQSMSVDLMSSTGGRWVLALAGAGLAALGAGLIWYGVSRQFERHLHTDRMSGAARRLAGRLGLAGYASKGVAYGIAGALFVVAAVTYDAERARGLDAAMRTLGQQAYGTTLLIIMALGVAAFAAYCLVQARWRKV